MFRVGKYKIVFMHTKQDTLQYEVIKGKNLVVSGSGRYDTSCHIYINNDTQEIPQYIGFVKLHPNDKPDKIIGKKIALQNALISQTFIDPKTKKKITIWHHQKNVRTKIWKAFWAWVESWEDKKKIEFEGWIDSYIPSPINETNVKSFSLSVTSTNVTNELCKNLILHLGKKSKITIEKI